VSGGLVLLLLAALLCSLGGLAVQGVRNYLRREEQRAEALPRPKIKLPEPSRRRP
jgi:hypothetical protein